MTAFATRLTMILVGLCLACIGSTRAVSEQDFDLAGFNQLFRTSTACVHPCLMGIRAGMELPDALEILGKHEWVTNITLFNSVDPDVDVAWNWSGKQPDFIEADVPGRIHAGAPNYNSNHVVLTIRVETTLRIPDVAYALADTAEGSASYIAQGNLINYDVSYYDANTSIRTSLYTRLTCPAHLIDYFWNPHMQVVQRSDESPQDDAPPQTLPVLCRDERTGRQPR